MSRDSGPDQASFDALEARNLELSRQLRNSEERFLKLAEHMSEGFWLVDAKTHSLLYVNPAIERMWERSADDLLSLDIEGFLETIHVKDRKLFERAWLSQLPKGRFHQRLRIVTPTGELRHLSLRSCSLPFPEGQGVRYAGTVRDLTPMVEAREEMEQLEFQLQHSQRLESLGSLAGGVAHDFNNVITAILGNVELLRRTVAAGELNAELVNAGLDHIESSARDAASVTRQLLVFTGKQELQRELLSPELLVEETRRMLSRLVRENIHLEVSVDPDPWFLEGDLGQLKQVMMNLVINACDAMPHGGKLSIHASNTMFDKGQADSLRTSWREEPMEGPYVRISVSDNGCGMDEELISRVFEPFYTTKEQDRGTGLGLAMVKKIVHACGGRISVESQRDVGSTFYIYLPALCGEALAERLKSRPDLVLPQQKLAIPGPKQVGQRILLCEDEASVRELAARALEGVGYIVKRCDCAEAALRAHAQATLPYELLVTDVVLPGLSGVDLAKQLTRRNPKLPVLYMSGYTGNEVLDAGLDRERCEFLNKPFGPQLLLERVRASLDRSAPRAIPEGEVLEAEAGEA